MEICISNVWKLNITQQFDPGEFLLQASEFPFFLLVILLLFLLVELLVSGSEIFEPGA